MIPFSSFHQYQRTDSAWTNEYTTPIEAYSQGFNSSRATILPAFVEIDCTNCSVREINPPKASSVLLPPDTFGDYWDEPLEKEDIQLLSRYFQAKEMLEDHIGFINFRVGGKEYPIILNKERKTGITFECPRNSLLTAVQYEVFDDLLIGNFMKTTLHGLSDLSTDFAPIVTRFADNGRAQSKAEISEYLKEYRRRAPFQFLVHQLEKSSSRVIRHFVSRDSRVFRLAKRSYFALKRI